MLIPGYSQVGYFRVRPDYSGFQLFPELNLDILEKHRYSLVERNPLIGPPDLLVSDSYSQASGVMKRVFLSRKSRLGGVYSGVYKCCQEGEKGSLSR